MFTLYNVRYCDTQNEVSLTLEMPITTTADNKFCIKKISFFDVHKSCNAMGLTRRKCHLLY